METQKKNKDIVLAEHPIAVPTKATFKFNEIEMPNIKKGQVLLKSLFISVDPGMCGIMDKGEDDATGLKFELNKPITTVVSILRVKGLAAHYSMRFLRPSIDMPASWFVVKLLITREHSHQKATDHNTY